MRREISQKEKDLVVQLYSSKFKIDDIVSLTKLSPSTINRIANESNLKKRKSTQPLNETIEKMLSTLEFILKELNDLKKIAIRIEVNDSKQEPDEKSFKDESEDDDIFLSLSEIKQKIKRK